MNERLQSNRRDFLRGRIAEIDPGDPEKDLLDPQQQDFGYLEQYSTSAMACQFEILLNMRQYPQAAQAVMDAIELIESLEDQLSIYRDQSEVSQLNRTAASSDVATEAHLFGLLQLAKQIHADTDGAFDITSAPLTKLWGFEQRSGKIPPVDAVQSALQTVGTKHLSLEPNAQAVQYLHPDLGINLGGIGKGHALDRVAEVFAASQVGDFIVHGGQSSVLARGSQLAFDRSDDATAPQSSANQNAEGNSAGWVVGLSHPTVPEVRLAEFILRDQALGTSGTGRQGFFHQGKRYGHIIDPRTGWPTDHVLSATVISPSAALSDALATAFFVMDLDQVAAYCQQHPEVAALLVVPGKAKGRIGMEWFNLADDNWRRLF